MFHTLEICQNNMLTNNDYLPATLAKTSVFALINYTYTFRVNLFATIIYMSTIFINNGVQFLFSTTLWLFVYTSSFVNHSPSQTSSFSNITNIICTPQFEIYLWDIALLLDYIARAFLPIIYIALGYINYVRVVTFNKVPFQLKWSILNLVVVDTLIADSGWHKIVGN